MPTGVHDCDLAEIEAVFVYNGQRRLIWRGFRTFLELIKPLTELNSVYLDGSFITDNPHPNDVDIIIEYADSNTRYRLREDNWFLRLRGRVLDLHSVDVLGCLENEPAPNMTDFFQLLRPQEAVERGLPAGTRKGILRIKLR